MKNIPGEVKLFPDVNQVVMVTPDLLLSSLRSWFVSPSLKAMIWNLCLCPWALRAGRRRIFSIDNAVVFWPPAPSVSVSLPGFCPSRSPSGRAGSSATLYSTIRFSSCQLALCDTENKTNKNLQLNNNSHHSKSSFRTSRALLLLLTSSLSSFMYKVLHHRLEPQSLPSAPPPSPYHLQEFCVSPRRWFMSRCSQIVDIAYPPGNKFL